jgi:aminoglycoside phosphotransferase (APT) family kinase protein
MEAIQPAESNRSTRFDDAGLPVEGAITEVRQLTGGSQNNLFMLNHGTRQIVLRRSPRHLRANSNETMLREAHLLKALAGSDVPHPALLAVCTNSSMMSVNFFLMEPLEGFSPAGQLQGRYATDASWRYQMGEAFVRAAASLSQVDYQQAGLEDFGRLESWYGRQVDRWRSQLDGYRDTPAISRVAYPASMKLDAGSLTTSRKMAALALSTVTINGPM